jgi:hypothetical protein
LGRFSRVLENSAGLHLVTLGEALQGYRRNRVIAQVPLDDLPMASQNDQIRLGKGLGDQPQIGVVAEPLGLVIDQSYRRGLGQLGWQFESRSGGGTRTEGRSD